MLNPESCFMKIYDISQTIREGMAVWPGDQEFRLNWNMQLRQGHSCNVSNVTMSIHTGTHLDAPYHFDEAGAGIADVPLEHYLGPARVLDLPVNGQIRVADLRRIDWAGVERVLFKTRVSDLPEDRFDETFVFLSHEGAEYLGGLGLRLVGTDAPSIDAFESKDLLSHKILLRHSIAILEGVRLGSVPPGDYELIALPLKFAGLDGSPVRAILRSIQDSGSKTSKSDKY
jgi:arylformamidase